MRIASLGIIGTQLRAPLNPLEPSHHYGIERFNGFITRCVPSQIQDFFFCVEPLEKLAASGDSIESKMRIYVTYSDIKNVYK